MILFTQGCAGQPSLSGGGLFENVTAESGFRGVESPRVQFYDVDRDGFPDAVLDQTRIFMNAPGPGGAGRRFLRAAWDAALEPLGKRRATIVQFADLDNDGDADCFYGRNTEFKKGFVDDGLRSEIWLADGKGGFRQSEDNAVGAVPETHIASCFVDYDRDGILDLFIGNSYEVYGKGLESFPDRLFRGKGDGTFEDVTEKAGLLGIREPGKRESRKPTFGVIHTDWDNDGWQDLLVCTYGRQWNRLWKNNGDGTFADVGEETTFDGDEDETGLYPDWGRGHPYARNRPDDPPWRSNGNTFDCAPADFDGDGDMDCFLSEITHYWAGPSSDLSALLVNQGPGRRYRFLRDAGRIARVHDVADWDQGDLHAEWADVDNDGFLDLWIASSDYPNLQLLRLYRQNPDHSFEEWTDRLGFRWRSASQVALADFDRDGATDLLVGTSHMRLTPRQQAAHSLNVGLFRNVFASSAGNRFLNLRLEGLGAGKANRDAVGARVTIWTGERRQVREVYGGDGHAGARNDADCRFGVGKAEKVDKIEVRWPDAAQSVQGFENVGTNRFYRLKQGGVLEEVK